MHRTCTHYFKIALLLFLLAICSVAKAQQVPQFKFYLAFEDAKNERDTVWFGIDEDASQFAFDTLFGDTLVPYDSTQFHVFFGKTDTLMRSTIINGTDQSSHSLYVDASKFLLPITIKWDTNLFTNNNLPFELKQAWIYNSSLFFSGFPNGYDLWKNVIYPKKDSIVLDSFFIGGGLGDHFPLKVFFSKNASSVGITENGNPVLKLYPNPVESDLFIDSDENLSGTEVSVYDLQNRMVMQANLAQRPWKIPVDELPPGSYFLFFQTNLDLYHARFVKE